MSAERRFACRRGHPYEPGSFTTRIVVRNGKSYEDRECHECRRIRQRKWLASKKRPSCSVPSSPQPEQSSSGDPLLDAFSAAVLAATLKK